MNWRLAKAAVLLGAALSISSLAVAQDRDGDDGYYRQGHYGQAQQYGYQNGYRAGLDKGRHEGRENDPNDYRTPDWRSASSGYQQWMGSLGEYQRAYRDGYSNGFRAGYQAENRDRDNGQNAYYGGGAVAPRPFPYPGRYPVNGNGQYYPARYESPAYSVGYQDGSSQAREDLLKRKPFNANPRGRYDDEDHGYNSSYGSKNAYKSLYADGYRAGYQAAFRRY
ncbi:MAG: hypothetical protein H0X25_15265 [Acidobacteriales bacterium]|nr:hypothetical protein [Terriglobales bacterium]